jgi:hypothetical protein
VAELPKRWRCMPTGDDETRTTSYPPATSSGRRPTFEVWLGRIDPMTSSVAVTNGTRLAGMFERPRDSRGNLVVLSGGDRWQRKPM